MRWTGVWVSVFWNSVTHEIFSEFLQPFRYVRTQRVSPFYIVVFVFFGFGILGWLGQQRVAPFYHQHVNLTQSLERDVIFNSILSFSSLISTWCCCGWRRRAWRRCRTMPLLSWRCHWCWRVRTGWRTCWQAWNHDRKEVFCIANYPNPVFNEMWLLTTDPFIRMSVFIAKLSKRQYCWRVFEDFHSQEKYPILWHTLWPLHASALLHWRLWLS